MKKSEISLPDILRILLKRKFIIIISILLCIVGAFIFNMLKKPVYQSSVLLKKELILEDKSERDPILSLLSLRSQDELETEMQLVQTRSVINKTIDELSLNILITKVIEQDGTVTIINLPVSEYKNNYNLGEYPDYFPAINNINVGLRTKENEFRLMQNNGSVNLFDKSNNNVFESNIMYSDVTPDQWIFNIEWKEKQVSEIHFNSLDYNDAFDEIIDNIFTDKKIKTNIFELGVKSNYPFTTKLVANTLADKFKEVRFSQKKDNIKLTYEFIDERLNEVSENLKTAENDLSEYKSKEQIVQIDEQSKRLIEFLSNLESEKLNNDLELALYRNKFNDIEKEMDSEGFVDQTYLTPEQYQATDSPFSNLMNELSRLELNRIELMQKRTESHPDVVLLSEQISRVKSELAKYNQNTLTAYKIISGSLDNKRSQLSNLINKYSGDLKNLPSKEANLASLIRQRDVYEKMYTLLLDKREEMKVAELSKMQDIIILDPAIEPVKPISPNKKLNLLFAGLFGLFAGLFAAFITHFTDNKISDIREIENSFNYPILSVIPPYDKKIGEMIESTDIVKNRFISMMDNQFRHKEAYRTLETKLATKIEGKPKKVMITSCEENAGKTTSAVNLAITIAQSGKKVLLIDCDIKNPSIADKFGLPKFSSGLIDYLIENTDTPNIYKPIKLSSDSGLLMNLDIIPTGVFTNISGEVLASERMQKLMDDLSYYDFVILDTPPITRLADALSLGRLVKDTLLVVRAGQTIKESISWAVGELNSTDTNFVGLLVNDCEIKKNSYKYQYGYKNT